MCQISQALSNEQIVVARALLQEYAVWLGVDLEFQGFAAELSGLPGSYAPPRGRLLLATVDAKTAGCVALRPLAELVCEMKRLYVRPEFRGRGVGRQLAEAVIRDARLLGYTRMRLDTLAPMEEALRLYISLGFVRRDAYYETPLPDTVFMELVL